MAKQGSSIRLPSTYKEWEKIKCGLKKLAEKRERGLDTFETIYKDEIDPWDRVRPPFKLLRRVLADGIHMTEEFFCERLLPWLASKALQVEELFKDCGYKLPKLFKQKSGEVTLTRRQACCILALAFFNLPEELGGTYQQLTLIAFIEVDYFGSQKSKLICLLKYFERIMLAEEADDQEFLSLCITIERKNIAKESPDKRWGACKTPLVAFEPKSEGLIEDAHGCLQVDFANAYIGGGVLQMGNVQEEIRFVINPECLISLLFCESMDDNEAILIRGAEQFSSYAGYGGRFKYAGAYADSNPIDERNRRCVSIVAIDAIPASFEGSFQYDKPDIVRELNKACCGFSFTIPGDRTSSAASPGELVPVATGNWGCGAFGGDKALKTLIQWMAASKVGRAVQYFTFREKTLSKRQEKVVKLLLEHKVTVGQLYSILTKSKGKLKAGSVFEYVMDEASKL